MLDKNHVKVGHIANIRSLYFDVTFIYVTNLGLSSLPQA
jgi:hypothetical protein